MLARVSGGPGSMTLPRTISLAALASITIGATTPPAETGRPAEAPAESIVSGAVTGEELAALANDVNLPAWMQLALSRDFTSIEEGWVTVYLPKDPVGAARDWSEQVKTARSLSVRAGKTEQRRWLGLFIKAGEAIGRRDASQLSATLRALQSDLSVGRIAIATTPNFFTAK